MPEAESSAVHPAVFSLPDGASLAFVEALYMDFLKDPQSVDPEWRVYFDSLPRNGVAAGSPGGPGAANGKSAAPERLGPSFKVGSIFHASANGSAALPGPPGSSPFAPGSASASPARSAPVTRTAPAPGADREGRKGRPAEAILHAEGEAAALQDRVDQLIRAYRVRGHLLAQIDPLGIPRPDQPEIHYGFFGLKEEDLEKPFSTATIYGPETLPLRQIVERMHNTYCRSIGVQFYHIDDIHVRRWLQERMEGTENRIRLDPTEQLRILTRLTDAVIFEEFIQKKFQGAKSFSLEGSESLIPLLDLALEKAGEGGTDEVVIAMAHRGRLNVLANIMGKSPRAIFREFEDPDPELYLGRGDVKYHLGYSNDWKTITGHKIHISLSFNPSHLEFVNPVALGRTRAKQDRLGDAERTRSMAILIHGDAAFAGEGVVQETLNLSQLKGYTTGGTLHVVVNNQIGFTTSPQEARSTTYATDVAKMLQIPIFHVNGEDPEAVAQVVRLALDFRAAFRRDVVIDMYGYRRRGHNEGDEPSFTQPLLYAAIEKRPPVREGYLQHLLKLGGVSRQKADDIGQKRRQHLEEELNHARSKEPILQSETAREYWKKYHGGPESGAKEADTAVPAERLSSLLAGLTQLPEGFKAHPKIVRLLEARREMSAGRIPLDWSAGEALAFATLAEDGVPIRLTGQDCGRGTFSHRHAVLTDIATGNAYVPLQHLSGEQGPVEIHNSPLCEIGVLGFEYGYSLDRPSGLTLWEAQFGDFTNVAQVIIDQFIASAEDKWKRLSGLTLLLPHGFEGMGPEHSSARLERFLMLAAGDNIQVANPTTPAQLFHLLRRQVLRAWRKPLVIMTPKSLLRLPLCASPLADLASGGFRKILPDALDRKAVPAKRILLCSGKLYYELVKKREELDRRDVAILRLEQLYPLPEEDLVNQLAPFPAGTPVFWVQEEPENMGAWRYLRVKLGDSLIGRLPFAGISRAAAASPATGSASSHALEQRRLLGKAFGDA